MKSKKQGAGVTDMGNLVNRLLLTIDFIEQAQEFPSGNAIRKLVNDAAARGDARALRLMCKEIEGMRVALTPPQREELDGLLQDSGIDLDAERAKTDHQMAAILKRGAIASERERRRLEDYLAMLETTDGDQETMEKVRALLSTS